MTKINECSIGVELRDDGTWEKLTTPGSVEVNAKTEDIERETGAMTIEYDENGRKLVETLVENWYIVQIEMTDNSGTFPDVKVRYWADE